MSRTTGKIESEPRPDEVVAALEEEIALGHLAPKERLVEEDIAERFGVKRHVVRQALLDLVAMGLVVRQPNRGAAVRDFSVEEVEQLYVVRTLVEGEAVKFIPMPAPAALIETLQQIHARHSDAVEAGDLRRVFRENLQFHRTLFAACGNVPLAEIIEQLAFKTHGIRHFAVSDPEIVRTAVREHLEIIALLQTDRRDELMQLVKQHLEPSKNVYLRQARHKILREAPRG